MSNVPKKHRDMAHKWVDGAEIEWNSEGWWETAAHPSFYEEYEYRVKPKPITKRWQWWIAVKCESNADGWVCWRTTAHYTEEGIKAFANTPNQDTCTVVLSRDESSMIEVEVEDQPCT